jgi:hypothetical protein
MSPLRWFGCSLGAAVVMMLGGCDLRDSDAKDPTPEELTLLDRLQRDNFIIIVDQERNDDGYLVITTQQGDTQVRYLLAPDGPESKQLKIRRMVEDFPLQSSEPERIGVGPEPRGLEH